MADILLVQSLEYLAEAEEYASMYVELDDYSEIFEADNPEVQQKMEQNKKAVNGANSSLKKAGNAILAFIQNLIDKFKSLFSGRKKKELEGTKAAFNAAVSKNPSLKNKTVQMKDMNAINSDYTALMKKMDAAEKELDINPNLDISEILKMADGFVGNLGSRTVAAYKVELALNMASTSQALAAKMYNNLKNDAEAEQKYIDAIGKKNTKKFEKDLKRLASKNQLIRSRAKVNDEVCKNISEAISVTNKTVAEMLNGGFSMAADAALAKQNGENPAKAVLTSGQLGKNVKNMTDSKSKRRFVNNMGIVNGGITTYKNVKEVKNYGKPTKKQIKAANKRQKEIEKNRARGDYSDQSIAQAFLGDEVGRKVNNAVSTVNSLNQIRKQIIG